MGILYLDEAGNTGLWDSDQTLLVYGGPYVGAKEWKVANDELAKVQAKYKALIMGRFQSGLNSKTQFARLEDGVHFLSQFHFHARDIANKKGLWSKLKDDERFQVMEDVIDVLFKHNIPFYLGALDKVKLRPAHKPKKNTKNEMTEYKVLLPSLLGFIENDMEENAQIVTIMDDGDPIEKEVIRESLRNTPQVKFMGELVCGKYADYPILQIADIGIWIFQAFHRLGEDREDEHAKRVRSLYKKLSGVIKVSWC